VTVDKIDKSGSFVEDLEMSKEHVHDDNSSFKMPSKIDNQEMNESQRNDSDNDSADELINLDKDNGDQS